MEYIFLFIFGCAIGSFLNVLVDRLPFDESINGRSHCDSCKKTIAWYDLVPLISYFVLRRKCRNCKKKLSLYYPVVEIVTGILFILTWIYIPQGINQAAMSINPSSFLFKIAYLGIISMLIVIFFADAKYHIIPDQIQLGLFIFTLIVLPRNGLVPAVFVDHVVASFLIMAPIWFLHYITKGQGMGFGDVKLAFIIGLLMGAKDGFLALYISFILGAIVGLIFMIFQRRGLKSKIAFGPFMVLGLLIMFFWKENVYLILRKIYGF